MSTAEVINNQLAAGWEMCCDAVGIDTDVTAAEWRETYDAQLAGERRKAKIEELRSAAEVFGENQMIREGDVKEWLKLRADRMEEEK